jgi:hypothetical protein
MNFDLAIYHIQFLLEAQSQIHMGAQAGSQLRGALWEALSEIACLEPAEKRHPSHALHCPSCFLMELQSLSPRGENPPRPFAIRPPAAVRVEDERVFMVGDRFDMQMTLMGKATGLFPYLVQGLAGAGHHGVGYGRGRFSIQSIESYQPFKTEKEELMANGRVQLPSLRFGREEILMAAEKLPTKALRLRFLSPTTLKDAGQILKRPDFTALIKRILERAQATAYHYGETSGEQSLWQPLYAELSEAAAGIRLKQDNTRWVDLQSGSRRSNRYNDIGGFVGEALFEGDLRPFHEWILWGQVLQAGKNVVKGNGAYEIAEG